MKKWFIICIITLFTATPAIADWDEYHEIEENTPAYQDGSVYGNGSPYGSDIVKSYYPDGSWRYTTAAQSMRWGRPYRPVGYRFPNCGWNPGYSTVGKRFYPNSNYKREIKAKKKYGLISSVLSWLI